MKKLTTIAIVLGLALVASPAYVPPVEAASTICTTNCYLAAELAYLQCLENGYSADYCYYFSQKRLARCLAECPLPK